MEQCANCHGPIGDLETPYIYRDRIVCVGCYEKLARPPALTPVPTGGGVIPYASPATPPPAVRRNKDDIICPNTNCGYVGPGVRKSKGSALVMVFLLLFWILPGILYAIIYNGHTLNCPRCGIKIRDD